MIQGYATPSSVFAGKTIKIHVGAAKDPRRPVNQKEPVDTKFRTYFFRRGATWQLQGVSDVQTAKRAKIPDSPNSDPKIAPKRGDATGDWNWDSFEFTIPKGWPSGAYVAVFVEGDGPPDRSITPDDLDKDLVGLTGSKGQKLPKYRQRKYYYSSALFVLKVAPEDPGIGATILYKVPLFTYCAYNYEGKASLYKAGSTLKINNDDDISTHARKFKATLCRPGCGLGGDPWDAVGDNPDDPKYHDPNYPFDHYPFDDGAADVYDDSSPRQTFSHWDAPFISWLESNGNKVDYCTDLDLHESYENKDGFLQNYSLLLSVGHDEYWSQEMRSNVKDFIDNGGNVAYFSGNTCWWRVHLEESNTALTCDKAPDNKPADQWRNTGNPETKFIGVSYQYGGGWWGGKRDSVGFTVQNPNHWVFDNVKLARKDLGADEALVGYECDGAGIKQDPTGNYVLSHPNDNPGFQILGVGRLNTTSWQDIPNKENQEDIAAATMGVWERPGKGTVFTAATTDWARVLAAGNQQVQRITNNVLTKLA